MTDSTPLSDLERQELEAYRSGRVNVQIATYYLLVEELGVQPGGSLVDTVTELVKDRRYAKRVIQQLMAYLDDARSITMVPISPKTEVNWDEIRAFLNKG